MLKNGKSKVAGATFFGGAIAAVALFGGGAIGSAHAESITAGPVGTWTVEVTPHGVPTPPFMSTLAFTPGAVVIEATSKPHVTPQGALSDSTEGLGVWEPSGSSGFRIDFHKYDFNASGAYTGLTTIHENDTLSSAGNSYSGAAQVTVTNPAGVVITQFTATSQAIRMTQ